MIMVKLFALICFMPQSYGFIFPEPSLDYLLQQLTNAELDSYLAMPHRNHAAARDLQLRFPVGILQIRVSQLRHRHPGVQGAHLAVGHPRGRGSPRLLSAGRHPLHPVQGRMLTDADVGHGADSRFGFGPSAHLQASGFGLWQGGAFLEVDGRVRPLVH